MARLKNLIKYGWLHSKEISNAENKNRYGIFVDILMCYYKYRLLSNQYKKEKFYNLDKKERALLGKKYEIKNNERDRWTDEFLNNQRFLLKWTGLKYSLSGELREKRDIAYKKQYRLNHLCKMSSGVMITKHHYTNAEIIIGEGCRILDDVNIDYTGNITIGNRVSISEGTKILTHNHSTSLELKGDDKGCILTPLVIHDRVWIGTRCTIMPGVKEIGRGALISADTCINKKVPPYAIVMGNPAKIVGFRMTLGEIVEYEKRYYAEEERTSIETLSANYKRFFLDRWKEIKEWNKY